MSISLLGYWAPNPIEVVVIFISGLVPILLIILAIQYMWRSKKERQQLHQEINNLTNEVQQLRQVVEEKHS